VTATKKDTTTLKAAAEDLVREVFSTHLRQSVDEETVKSVAQKILKAVPSSVQRKKVAT
jgi:hypothetical protein